MIPADDFTMVKGRNNVTAAQERLTSSAPTDASTSSTANVVSGSDSERSMQSGVGVGVDDVDVATSAPTTTTATSTERLSQPLSRFLRSLFDDTRAPPITEIDIVSDNAAGIVPHFTESYHDIRSFSFSCMPELSRWDSHIVRSPASSIITSGVHNKSNGNLPASSSSAFPSLQRQYQQGPPLPNRTAASPARPQRRTSFEVDATNAIIISSQVEEEEEEAVAADADASKDQNNDSIKFSQSMSQLFTLQEAWEQQQQKEEDSTAAPHSKRELPPRLPARRSSRNSVTRRPPPTPPLPRRTTRKPRNDNGRFELDFSESLQTDGDDDDDDQQMDDYGNAVVSFGSSNRKDATVSGDIARDASIAIEQLAQHLRAMSDSSRSGDSSSRSSSSSSSSRSNDRNSDRFVSNNNNARRNTNTIKVDTGLRMPKRTPSSPISSPSNNKQIILHNLMQNGKLQYAPLSFSDSSSASESDKGNDAKIPFLPKKGHTKQAEVHDSDIDAATEGTKSAGPVVGSMRNTAPRSCAVEEDANLQFQKVQSSKVVRSRRPEDSTEMSDANISADDASVKKPSDAQYVESPTTLHKAVRKTVQGRLKRHRRLRKNKDTTTIKEDNQNRPDQFAIPDHDSGFS